jgi:hypothetical protein
VRRERLAKPLGLFAGAAVFAVGLGISRWGSVAANGSCCDPPTTAGTVGQSPVATYSGFYAPLRSVAPSSYFSVIAERPSLTSASPGLVALLLAALLTVVAALAGRRAVVLISLAAAAAAAAIAASPGLDATVRVALFRLALVLLPAAAALGTRRLLTGAWPWRTRGGLP